MLPPPPTSTLFPYTTLFRSRAGESLRVECLHHAARRDRAAEHFEPAVAKFLGEVRSEEHTSELQSHHDLVCRLLLEKKKKIKKKNTKKNKKKENQYNIE